MNHKFIPGQTVCLDGQEATYVAYIAGWEVFERPDGSLESVVGSEEAHRVIV